MKTGPDIALVAALLGDPARANMLTALTAGQALTAGELAAQAGVTAQTASSHLAKLEAGGLITLRRQGRHRYFALSGPDVAAVLEGLMGLALRAGHQRTRTGPKEPALREARICYDHLAGDRGVELLDAMIGRKLIAEHGETLELTPSGQHFVRDFGIDLARIDNSRRPLCKSCLDWSVRRSHLAGALGAALLTRFQALGWARQVTGTRIIHFTPAGLKDFRRVFPA
ncbi:MAG: ArsR family transcriptional regulator [Alphaproteobacteria bacterium]|nr:ArsR family transcriptional regulator [Alphaproteobacteria bacterium]MBU0797286.1 ArsR family transcriptional regulator [Alphaproteobacteria bacterium]MBU0888926.1 ArsR family transcriptional regulator [Alphaproteobacteria bacterium]MBU1813946.1 ArsR family transcriptional regulator [Alphaproteobacteria bacterium]